MTESLQVTTLPFGAAMKKAARSLMPDYLRLIALFGIVVVNVQFIAFSAVGSFADPSGETELDTLTLWMVIGEVERFPEMGRSLHENGPGRTIARLKSAIVHFTSTGELRCDDPTAAAAHFNWLVMGDPTNAAMFLGDSGIPSKSALEAHARESVRIFLMAFGSSNGT